MEQMKNVIVTVTTKKQNIMAFFYVDTYEQDSVDFIRSLATLHDRTIDYRVSVKMYSNFKDLYDMSDMMTGNIMSVVSFVSMYASRFLRG